VSLRIPSAESASHARRAEYISAATQSASLAVNGQVLVAFDTSASHNPNCAATSTGTTCTATVAAAIGTDTFTLSTYDGTVNAAGTPSGSLLSTGTASKTITPGTANAVNLVLSGAVASLEVVAANTLTVGTAGTSAITVNALDADGNTIVGSPSYVDASGNPLVVTVLDSDPGQTTKLSGLAISAPGASVSLSYDGTIPYGKYPTVTASAHGLAPASTLVAMTPSTVSYPLSGIPYGIVAAANGVVYVAERNVQQGASSGIAALASNGVVTETTLPTSDPFDNLAQGTDGRLYIGLTPGGLDIYNPGSSTFTTEPFAAAPSVPTEGVVARGADGRIWELAADTTDSPNVCYLVASTNAGAQTSYPYGSGACATLSMVLASDGRLWFSGAPPANMQNAFSLPQGTLYAASSNGTIANYSLPASSIYGASVTREMSGLAAGPGTGLFGAMDDGGLGCEGAIVNVSSGAVQEIFDPSTYRPPNVFDDVFSCMGAVVADVDGDFWTPIDEMNYDNHYAQITRWSAAGVQAAFGLPANDSVLYQYAGQTARDAAGNLYFITQQTSGIIVKVLY
jgi:hypothetical protein